ncbi:hypothetical protein PVAG01_00435 [Phlyctema vagabunda]|uniref:Galactose oxidase n=1 Tax=Phlyctema vagabunda TaxID=108571 RepID=A0ABR4PUK7_9HELO
MKLHRIWTASSCLLVAAYSQSLPYNPTTILLSRSSSGTTSNIAYAFLFDPSTAQHSLVAIDISSSITASNLPISTITDELPFPSDDSTAFIPTLSPDGEISVYTGSCTTSTSSALWIFTPSNTSSNGTGSWEQKKTRTAGQIAATDLPGADFLSRAISFSPLVSANISQASIYLFGGMCPSTSATASTWQSAASYSNNMLRLSPPSSSTSGSEYTLALQSSRGPPIAEAGFSITGLAPTFANVSGVVTQAQNFLLIGGHTQTAFINMSQVAIWSLPEASWSFVGVESPDPGENTELAVKSIADRAITSIDSRSGHTAVLSDDGTSIIIYGGWVGNVNTAADPQLAIMNLGSGFGGPGDWTWSVPDEQPSGDGIYGHGAVMLPGNVMMVMGGYNISSSTSKRAEAPTSASAAFYNVTSLTWMANYTNPVYVAAAAEKAANSNAHARQTAQRVGLGAGLGLGFLAIVGAFAVYFWYSRRLRRKRIDEREKEIREMSLGASNYYSGREMGERGGYGFGAWNNHHDDDLVYDTTSMAPGYENLNAGVHNLGDSSNIPSPQNKQIQRKPLHSRTARGLYQATPTFDTAANHGRSNSLGTAGPIHPIYEADEEVENSAQFTMAGVGLSAAPTATSTGEPRRQKSYRRPDPFQDPTGQARPGNSNANNPSPEEMALEREREISEWVSDWAAAEALLSHQAKSHSTAGRISPTKRAQLLAAANAGYVSSEEDSGRTTSNLSERSIAISGLSRSESSSNNRSRSNSLRGFISNAMLPFTSTSGGSTNISPIFDRPGPSGARPYPAVPKSGGSTGSSSFNTAQTSFPALQAEAEILLPWPDEYSSSRDNSPTRPMYAEPLGSPSKQKGLLLGRPRAQGGWLGSIRRVFTGDASSRNGPEGAGRSGGEQSPTRLDPRLGAAGVEPRRTVSAGATLWRRKQGKVDWEDSTEGFDPSTPRSATFTGDVPSFHRPSVDHPSEADDEDWDIERAVERRVVQVMFTVPKERLRVVNHDVADLDDASDVGSLKSRKGSQRENLVVASSSSSAGPTLGPDPVLVVQPLSLPDRSVDKGKGIKVEKKKELHHRKSRVLEIVEKLEANSSPDRSPEREKH